MSQPAAGLLLQALWVVACLVPAAAPGQGLGDAASRERQKRREASPGKVYTNQDLEARKKDAAEAAAGEAAAGDARSSDPVERERRERSLLEAEWRMRFADAREELKRAEAAAWTEVYRIKFVAGLPVQVKKRERVETDDLKRARQALAELEEEFRKTGLPAGWARE